MERKFWKKLEKWENEKQKEPLLVIGARQTGKTWIIQKFCQKTYCDYIYLNLEEHPEYISIFENTIDPDEIIRSLSIVMGRPIHPENCCIFIDEIQRSEKAINSLKYFCESPLNYRIITAGSLLGVKLQRFSSSFPVGKVKILYMYPLDFEEFLQACNEDLLIKAIREYYKEMKPLPEVIHTKAIRLYTDYLYIGGMPQAVLNYIEHQQNIVLFDRNIHRDLLTAYTADMTKYTLNPAEAMKITQTYESIPKQLARENPKFKYSEIRPYANKRDFMTSLDWLNASELVIPGRNVKVPASPLSVYEDDTNFKLYLSDTGLLCTMVNMPYEGLLQGADNIFKSAITENYVIHALHASGRKSWYYKPSQTQEIEQLLENKGRIYPVEIKSGRHKSSKSLNSYIKTWHPEKAYRLSELNFGKNDHFDSIPLYAAFCLFNEENQ